MSISDYMEVSELPATNGSVVLFPRMAPADPNAAVPARESAEAATWRKSSTRAPSTAAAAAAEAAPSQSTSPGIAMMIDGTLGAAALPLPAATGQRATALKVRLCSSPPPKRSSTPV
jgi:hypothetical protein